MSVNYPRVVRVVRPPIFARTTPKPQDGSAVLSGWSVGPTQIRYCGSVEKNDTHSGSVYNVTITGLGRTSGPPGFQYRALQRFWAVRAKIGWSDHTDQSQSAYISEVKA